MSFSAKKIIDLLKQAIPELEIQQDISWQKVTTWGVGGDIPILAMPQDDLMLIELFKLCHDHAIPYYILGGGANSCGMDRPYQGVVIRINQGAFKQLKLGRNHISCGAGVNLNSLAKFSAENGYGGVTHLSGIPGSVGGALKMNAGAEGKTIGEFVLDMSGVRADGSIWLWQVSDGGWGYRQSPIPEDVVVTAVIFEFPKCESDIALQEYRNFMQVRKQREPRGRSAGCVFRNPPNDSAGRLIDQAQLKGANCGEAIVSMEHANFIINQGRASEFEVVSLIKRVRKIVAKNSGVELKPEVVFVNKDSWDEIMSSEKSSQVLVLMGGDSSEREISLKSGKAVAEALINGGFEVTVEDIKECKLTDKMLSAEVIFPVLHGGFGEDGTLQKLLEQAGKKFVGCGSIASQIVMDKLASKREFDAANIPTAKWLEITRADCELPEDFNFPVFVKAPCEGSSFGIKKIESADDWQSEIDELFEISPNLLVEEGINGVEISVPVVNGIVLPPVEIRPPNGFYDFDAKYVYSGGHTEYFCPTVSLSEVAIESAKSYALKFYEQVGAKEMLRVDFIVDEDDVPFALEGNSLPGFTATSLVPKAAKVFGLSFEQLCAELIEAAKR